MSTRRKPPLVYQLRSPEGKYRGPNGRNWCRMCAHEGRFVEVPPRRQSYCSPECMERFRVLNEPGYVRQLLLERDKGVCARCNLDVLAFQRMVSQGEYAERRMKERSLTAGGGDLAPEHNSWLALLGVKQERRGGYLSGHTLIKRKGEQGWGEYFRQGAYCLLTDPQTAAVYRCFTQKVDARKYWLTVLDRLGFTRPINNAWWDADHIVPVVEGGGECDLSNYRTLCLPCHKVVTKELHARLAEKRRAEKGLPPKQERSRKGKRLVPAAPLPLPLWEVA